MLNGPIGGSYRLVALPCSTMAAIPGMTEPISFKFLWKEDHLSDYVLIICSEPDAQPHDCNHQHATAGLNNAPGASLQNSAGLLAQQPVQLQAASFNLQSQQGQALGTTTAAQPVDAVYAAAAGLSAAAVRGGRKRSQKHLQVAGTEAVTSATTAIGTRTRAAAAKRHRLSPTVVVPDFKPDPDAQTGNTTCPAAAATAEAISRCPGKSRRSTNSSISRVAKQQSATCSLNPISPSSAALQPFQLHHSVLTQSAAATAGAAADRSATRNISSAAAAAVVADAFGGGTADDAGQGTPAVGSRVQQHTAVVANLAASPSPESLGLSVQALVTRRLQDTAAAAVSTAENEQPAQYGYSKQVQLQQQQHMAQGGDEIAGGGSQQQLQPQLSPVPAAGPSQPALVVHAELPVHGAVLSVMSEYFRALIQNWQGSERRLQMLVAEDEAHVAEALVEFMYTGELPQLGHDDMLRLMRLSDRFQVKNCPAACARRFADTPMEELSLDTVCAIFDWPGFLQEAPPFAGVAAKAWLKLMDLFGDLEVAWKDQERRRQFLGLPFKAVRKLLASDDVAVMSENTVLIALAGWMEARTRSINTAIGTSSSANGLDGWGHSGSQQIQQQAQQHRELAELVRLQHLSPAFLGSVLKRVPAMANVASPDALMAAARYAAANEATRNKLQSMPNRIPRMKVLYAAPRARSAVSRLQFEWVLELSTVKAMIAQFKNTKVTVDRYSEPHYFNGFQWQLVLQVLEPPAKPQTGGQAAPPSVDVFVGTTARIQIGSTTHLPDVLYFRGQLAAREVASGEFTFVNRMESGFVCGTAGWGFRNFLRITDWDNESALRRFFYDGKIHLRCNIDQCE